MGRPRPAFLVLLGLAVAVAAFMLVKSSGGEEPAPAPPATDTAASAATPTTTAPAPAEAAPTTTAPAPAAEAAPSAGTAPSPPEGSGSSAGGDGFAGDPTEGLTKPVANAVAPVARAAADDKVALVFLYEPGAGDDLATRHDVRLLERKVRDKRAVVLSESVTRIGRYGPVLGGLGVSQAPAIAVVSPEGEARLLEGFTDTRSLDQFIADALR